MRPGLTRSGPHPETARERAATARHRLERTRHSPSSAPAARALTIVEQRAPSGEFDPPYRLPHLRASEPELARGADERGIEVETGEGHASGRAGSVSQLERRRARSARRRSFRSASRRSRAQSAALGDRCSSAQASRWRSMGTCASQQGTEQNTSAVCGRLQVDTLQAQYGPANGSSFLQVEHRFQNEASALIAMACVCERRYSAACRHLCGLRFRARWTTPTAATANGLAFGGRLRNRRFSQCHLRGNDLGRTTGTAWAPCATSPATTAPATVRCRLPRGDGTEQRLDRRADFPLNEIADHRQQAPLSRHRSSLPSARYMRARSAAKSAAQRPAW